MIEALTRAVLVVLLALPNTGLEESPAYATALAGAIVDASNGNPTKAAVLVAVGQSESRFLERIQAGDCRPPTRSRMGECDAYRLPDGRIEFRARGVWQTHRHAAVSAAEWDAVNGTDPHNVQTAARVAARALMRGWRLCRSVEGAIANYAVGTGCRWHRADERAASARNIEARLRSLMRQ